MPDRCPSAPSRLRFPPFAARPPWIGGDLQTLRNTIVSAFGRRPPDLSRYPVERLRFVMPDGTGDVLVGALNRPPGHAGGSRPLVVLVHGLTGSEDSLYMLCSAALLLAHGYPVLRLNLRGAGQSRPVCRLQYHAGRTADLRAVLERLPPTLAGSGLLVVGYSLGGNMLLKLLGEEGSAAPIRGAVAVSAPIDLKAAQLGMMRPRNAAYHRHVLSRMRMESLAPGVEIDDCARQIIRTVRTVYDFDDRFVAPRNGFRTADAYYRESSALRYLPGIRVPSLVIHAIDDPWIPARPYLEFSWGSNPSLLPLLPKSGGHVGFHGTARPWPWHDLCILAFFDALG